MRILYLDQTAELGGAELSLFTEVTNLPYEASVLLFQHGRLQQMFEAAGVTVEVVASAAAARDVRKASGVLAAAAAIPSVVRLVWAVARRARRHDLIYANSQKSFVVGAFAAALTRKRLVWRLRDVLNETHFSSVLIRIVVGLANWKASRVIANSEATARAFTQAGGDPRRVSVAYPGIDDVPFLTVDDAAVTATRKALGAGENKLVGIFGRLSPWKGQDVFVEALTHVDGVIGVIVGGPLFGEESFEQLLRRKIATLGLTDRIRLLGFRDDIPLLMRSMDVVVHCSVAPEPFGRVLVEAMLAGKPVVASAAGGVVEILEHGLTGSLVPPGNLAQLSSAIARAATGGVDVEAEARAGHQKALNVFTVRALLHQIQDALNGI